jgi:NAD-dependent deacetylase
MPYELDVIESALERCDEFVAIGTSGAVYPAAGFVLIAAEYGARTLELNLAESEITPLFDESRLGPASVLVAEWVEELV